ncbi:hypothetical protein NLU13_2601 [Sarocladium strictum]|uniref:Beta-xylosidase C-terminal Concanavalin A-like domain-containing protein n=1 Tax=Sarocladium strictum TaxID=5046 RepID=A0AA39GLB1_SARSR|nr:hypothetical protein NLU13_2601 [Sarocladium strictum]
MSINPIIPGFAPDPSIVRVDDWFFLVTSTFHLFPGIPIYASQDLTAWRHIGNAIHRPGQISLARSATKLVVGNSQSSETMLAAGGLYAPTIRHHDGVFYVVCTNVIRANAAMTEEESQNFIVSCTDIWKCQWSDAVPFDFKGIDPSIFWDDDGKAYIQGSAGPGPNTKINQFEADLATGKKLGEEKTIWSGTGGIYPEGPHIYRKDGWYYLEISEGGTYDDHMVVMARSRALFGPYEANPHNPILTARGTDEAVQHTGHCDIFEDGQGRWWGVCLGVRKGSGGRLVMGRESFITPGRWVDGWFVMERVRLDPAGLARNAGQKPVEAEKGVAWLYIHDPDLQNYQISSEETGLTLTSTKVKLSEPWGSPTFVGQRQRALSGRSTATLLEDGGGSADLQAGLALYKDEHRYVRLFYDATENAVAWEHINNAKKISVGSREKLDEKRTGRMTFIMDYTEEEYRLSYDVGSGPVSLALVDSLGMTGPDFVGPVIGVFATSEKEGGVRAVFDDIAIE